MVRHLTLFAFTGAKQFVESLMRFTLGILLATACFAQIPFTIDNALSAPFATSPLPSPTGAKVAWLLNERGQRNIWVASAPDWNGHKITAFAKDDGQEIADVVWSPDASISYSPGAAISKPMATTPIRTSVRRSRISRSGRWRLDGSPAKKLTEGHAPAISPKGDSVAFVRGGQIYLMKPSGQDPALAVAQKGAASDLRWSPDGRLSRVREHAPGA